MRSAKLSERLRYKFDNFMSRGTVALVAALFLASGLIVVGIATLVWAFGVAPQPEGGEPPGLVTMIWVSAMRALDAGALGGDDGSASYLVSMTVVTVGGIFVVSALIGVLNSGLDGKLVELRKGKSRVVERGHTLIVGWSGHIHAILTELVAAAENHGGTTIVVVADRDKVEMDDEIATKVPALKGSRIVTRSGSPIDLDDLDLGSPGTAHAIIVLGPDGTIDPDASVIKTLLALVAHLRPEQGKHHIVAEIRDPKNRVPATMVGKDEALLVVTSEVIAKIAVQTCRQAGLSSVYTELLDFGGDEIYFRAEPTLRGKTFGESLDAFSDATVIGLVSNGIARVNPPMSTPLGEGDELIVIAEDDDAIHLAHERPAVDRSVENPAQDSEQTPERTLILGWNSRGALLVSELDQYAAKGSHVTIAADDGSPERALADLGLTLSNHEVRFIHGDITDRRLLDSLDVKTYQHVVTLAYSDKLAVQEADAITLVTLLHLRDIEDTQGEAFSIVSEMLDTRNQKLAEITKTDDFIVSDRLISLLIAQIASNRALAPVFDDLFDSDGSEIYLKDASRYVRPDAETTFATLLAIAKSRGEVAIGYAKGSGQSLATRINPRKDERLVLSATDRVIVIAES